MADGSVQANEPQRMLEVLRQGSDSFLKDPPNADLSVIVDGKLQQAVVVLRDPQLENGNLSYAVEILSGDMPELAQNASLFIDIIGMPLTPVSRNVSMTLRHPTASI